LRLETRVPKYKVFGSKNLNYWVDIEAEDGINAYDRATELDSHMWNELEDDDVIEPVDVYEIEPEVEKEVIVEDEEEFQFDPVNVIGDTDEA
jgi:hypothetical protein